MENIYKVYKHINKSNNKIYIGLTRQPINRRWRNGDGYIRNEYFTRAIKKYGWDGFEHIILFDRLTKQEAEDIEIELISYYKSTDPKFGYNIVSGGSANVEISEETRRKMSLAKKGKYKGKNHPNYGKKMSEEQKRKIKETKIKNGVLRGKDHPNYGKHFIMSEETKKKISKSLSGEKNPMYGKTGKDSPYHKDIICLNTLKTYSSAREASRELNLFPNHITRVCKGKQSHCGGYRFMYLEEYNKIDGQ